MSSNEVTEMKSTVVVRTAIGVALVITILQTAAEKNSIRKSNRNCNSRHSIAYEELHHHAEKLPLFME